jgi:hypothetical protein
LSAQTSDDAMVGIHSVDLWFSLAGWPSVLSNNASLRIEVHVDLCSETTLVTEQKSIKVFAVGASGTAQRTVLEFPKDAKSILDGSAECGNI